LAIWPFNIFIKEKELDLPTHSANGIHAVIGLGNPGDKYQSTRHNIGFLFLDHLAQTQQQPWKTEKRFESQITTIELAGQELVLLKPQTFMNCSGQSVSKLMRYQRWPASSLVVAYDEINLPLGTLKLSDRGSAGGHNGIADILRHGAKEILRFRLGIGAKKHQGMELTDHVLGKFSREENELVQSKLDQWKQALEMVIELGPIKAMNFINRKDNRT